MDVDLVFPEATMVSTETSCEAAEEANPLDACTVANHGSDPGELPAALHVRLWRFFANPPVTYYDGPFLAVMESVPVFSLDPGESVRLSLNLSHELGLTDDQKVAAQTDAVQWDIRFVGRDPRAATTTG
jgi:hypothetical protein